MDYITRYVQDGLAELTEAVEAAGTEKKHLLEILAEAGWQRFPDKTLRSAFMLKKGNIAIFINKESYEITTILETVEIESRIKKEDKAKKLKKVNKTGKAERARKIKKMKKAKKRKKEKRRIKV